VSKKIRGADALMTAKYAQIYFNSWTFLWSGGNFIHKAAPDLVDGPAMWMPAFTNLCFACELFLRAILKSKGVQPTPRHQHNLRELFESLDMTAQSKIEGKLKFPSGTFQQDMEHLSTFYNKYRYIHDTGGSFNVGFLQDFTTAVREYWDEREKIIKMIKR